MNKIKKLSLIYLSLLLCVSLVGCTKETEKKPTTDYKQEQSQFDDFINQDFIDSISSNYLNMHIYLEHPENYGINKDDIEVSLGSVEDNQEDINDLKETNKLFKEFNRSHLTSSQKDTYDIAKFMLNSSLKGIDEKYKYYDNYYTTLTGIHSQLPTLFADLTLRDEQDVINLITLVNDTLPFINKTLDYTKKQEEVGTLMIDTKTIIDYCQTIIDEGENGSTLKSMLEHIESLNLSNKYTSSIKEAYQNSFIPAYQAIIATMKELDSDKNNDDGLSTLEYGKEYYELLFRDAIGSDKSVATIKEELSDLYTDSLNTTKIIATKNPDAYQDFVDDNIDTGYKDFNTMLKDLNNYIKDDFPSIGDIDYQIEPLSKDLANNGIAAYFNIPAIDGTTPKQIRVNTQNDEISINSLDTFSTVGHEGLPGHMYQYAYSYENLPNNWRKTIPPFSGYKEGYATYVELYVLKYLKNVDSDVITIHQNLSACTYALYALMDIGIHYEGWSVNDIKNFMDEYGFDSSQAKTMYQQLQNNPTAFLSYYVGYCQFINLQKEAKDALKDKYNDKDFHQAILKSGPAPFDVVERNVNKYIKKNK